MGFSVVYHEMGGTHAIAQASFLVAFSKLYQTKVKKLMINFCLTIENYNKKLFFNFFESKHL